MKFRASVTLDFDVECTTEDAQALLKHRLGQIGATVSSITLAECLTGQVHVTDPEEATIVYVDGGCNIREQGIGAWAWRAIPPEGDPIERTGGWWGSTNNRMELMAVIRALDALPIGPPIIVIADSEYVIKGCTQWARNWKKYGWKTSAGGDVKNRDLWEALLALYELHDISFRHVKGHSGDENNEAVDALCTATMAALKAERQAGKTFHVDVNGPAYEAA